MTQTIYKYTMDLRQGGIKDFLMPKGAQILAAGAQEEYVISIWVLCDPDINDFEARHIAVYGTGHAIPPISKKHIGTVLMRGGSLVWHVFEHEK